MTQDMVRKLNVSTRFSKTFELERKKFSKDMKLQIMDFYKMKRICLRLRYNFYESLLNYKQFLLICLRDFHFKAMMNR